MMKSMLRGGLLLAGLCVATQASALYRCGNVFQDKPCEAGVQERRLAPSGRAAPAAPAAAPAVAGSPHGPHCARVGEHAQRFSWQREGGATLERQLQDNAANPEFAPILQAVYARRGTTPEIRASIEAQCVADREKAQRAAEVLQQLQKQAGQAGSAAVAQPVPPPAAAAQPQPVSRAAPAEDPSCGYWRSRRDNVISHQRTGGSAAAMEQLQNERREVDRQLAAARC